ncbi:hypothetical protein OSB04_006045 [Centaurea solstitialis]|uniref:Uncharacterized protein n=1 Tax=Centaurea solstitialis TaxID=347529 RepID=A0AA38WQ39_9ASTR|nr:hypothetical protein OSB04_006045 [Centaurea solstitialis]
MVMQPTRNWLELPSDVMDNILFRVVDKKFAMCKQAVDRSQGQLIDITIGDFGNYELLQYVADRSTQLRHLRIISCDASLYKSWKALKKFPLLEELGLYSKKVPKEAVKAICCYCPSSLKTLKINEYSLYRDYADSCDKMGILIGENLHELEHLELIGNNMTDIGLQAILDGCRQLKLLDLRMSCFIKFEGGLEKRCLEQIECLIRPDKALKGSQYIYGYDDLLDDPEDYEFDDEWLSRLERSFTT